MVQSHLKLRKFKVALNPLYRFFNFDVFGVCRLLVNSESRMQIDWRKLAFKTLAAGDTSVSDPELALPNNEFSCTGSLSLSSWNG